MHDDCLMGCGNCPFRGKKIGPKGNSKADIVIVGESPGASELKAGIPFVGPSGKLIDSILPPDEEVFVTNALCCLPVGKNEKVLEEAVRCCNERLRNEIAAHPRKIIIALGKGALWSLTGDYSLKITQERGKRFPSPLAEHGIVAALHPAYLLRGGGSFPKFQNDLLYALALAKGKPTKTYIEPTHIVIDTKAKARWLKWKLWQQKEVASDIETTGLAARKARMLSIGFCFEPEVSYIVPENLISFFKKELESEKIKWIWHNGKFDIGFLRHNNIWARVDEDTMLLSYSLDETRGQHDLDQVASDCLGAPSHKSMIDVYLDTEAKKEDQTYELIPFHVLCDYHGKDLSKTLQIYRILRERVRNDANLEKLYTKTLIPASDLLYHIEATGFQFDWEMHQKALDMYEEIVERLRLEICGIAGYDINPRSPVQIKKLAYEELKIPAKRKKGKLSTDKKTVATWPDVPLKFALVKYRSAATILSTYIKGIAKHVHEDGRVYPTFLLHGTRTGRLACRKPNTQNVPREETTRGQFKAKDGYILIDIDASQAELRSLAIQSGDPDLLAIYNSTDRSLHKETAAYRYGPDYSEDEYVRAKAVNFGVIYGRTAHSLAEEFGISVQQAQAEIDAFWKQFPVAKAFVDRCRQAPLKKQVLVTLFGRKCRPGMVSRENMNEVQNEFANFPHQSTASDITLHVAMRIRPQLAELGASIVNLVHDSVVVECPDDPDKIATIKKIGYETFPQVAVDWGMTKCPFAADMKLCYNWGNRMTESKYVRQY